MPHGADASWSGCRRHGMGQHASVDARAACWRQSGTLAHVRRRERALAAPNVIESVARGRSRRYAEAGCGVPSRGDAASMRTVPLEPPLPVHAGARGAKWVAALPRHGAGHAREVTMKSSMAERFVDWFIPPAVTISSGTPCAARVCRSRTLPERRVVIDTGAGASGSVIRAARQRAIRSSLRDRTRSS